MPRTQPAGPPVRVGRHVRQTDLLARLVSRPARVVAILTPLLFTFASKSAQAANTGAPPAPNEDGSGWVSVALFIIGLGVLGGFVGLFVSVVGGWVKQKLRRRALGPTVARRRTVAPRTEGRTPDPTMLVALVLLAPLGALALVAGPFEALIIFLGALVFIAIAKLLPEAFLGFFIAAGPLQSSTYADAVPVDFVTIALAGLLAAVVFRLTDRRYRRFALPRGVIPFFVLLGLVLAGVLYAPPSAEAVSKALRFETITLIAFLSPLLIIRDRSSLMRTVVVIATTGLAIALLAVPSDRPSSPLVLPGDNNEIVVGLMAGLGLVAIIGMLAPVTRGAWRLVWIAPAGVVAWTVFGAGSRGALVGTVLACTIVIVVMLARPVSRRYAAVLLGLSAVAAPFAWAASSPAAKDKYLSTLQAGASESALDAGGGARSSITSAAVDLFLLNPMGVGTSGYPALTGFEWPHNIILELGAELGVIAIFVFLLLLAAVARAISRSLRAGMHEAIAVMAFLIVTVTLSMSSFDLNGNRVMWVTIGIALASGVIAVGPRTPTPRWAGFAGLIDALRPPLVPPSLVDAAHRRITRPLERRLGTSQTNGGAPEAERERQAIVYRVSSSGETVRELRLLDPPGGPRLSAKPGDDGRDTGGESKSSLAMGGLRAVIFRAASAAFGVALVILTARFMGADGRGLFAIASLVTLLTALPLGPVWSASAIELSHKRVPRQELLGAMVMIALVGGTLFGLAAFAFVPFISLPWWVVVFPAAITPLLLLARYEEGLLQGVGHLGAVLYMNLARAALPVAFMAAPLILGTSDQVAIGLWAASLALLPLIFARTVFRRMGGITWPRNRDLTRRLLRAGGELLIANSALLLNARLAILFLAIFATTAAVGVYSVAIAGAEIIYLASFALFNSTFHTIGSGSPDESLRVTIRAIRHAILLHAVGCLVLIPLLWLALPLIVGPGFEDVWLVVALMSPGLIVGGIFWVLHTYFTVQLANHRLIVQVAIVAISTNVLLGVALVPVIGIWGAAVASSASNIASSILAMRRFGKLTGTPLSRAVPGVAELRDYARLGIDVRERMPGRRQPRPRTGLAPK